MPRLSRAKGAPRVDDDSDYLRATRFLESKNQADEQRFRNAYQIQEKKTQDAWCRRWSQQKLWERASRILNAISLETKEALASTAAGLVPAPKNKLAPRGQDAIKLKEEGKPAGGSVKELEKTPTRIKRIFKKEVKAPGGQADARLRAVIESILQLSPKEQHRVRGLFGSAEALNYHLEVFGDVFAPATLRGFNQWLKDCVTEGSPKYKGSNMTDADRDFYAHAIQHFRDHFGATLKFAGTGAHTGVDCNLSTGPHKRNRRFFVRTCEVPTRDVWPRLIFPPLYCVPK